MNSVAPMNSVDSVFHALGDPTRRAIVETLSRGPCGAASIAAPLRITVAAVVQHLQVLESSGIVTSFKVGRVRECRLKPEGLSTVEHWINDQKSMWENRMDRLGELLAEE